MIKRQIDLKHHIDENGEIVKTGNNVVVPRDEPLILFRARDRLAIPMLQAYRQLCIDDGCNDFQQANRRLAIVAVVRQGQIDELIARFTRFAETHPEVMKQPGVTRGA